MTKNYYQQGDVIITTIENLPPDLEVFKENILAEGEHHNHFHRMQGDNCTVLIDRKTQTRYLRVIEPSDLTHEEHHTRTVPPGIYRIGIVREADHIEGIVRKVLD